MNGNTNITIVNGHIAGGVTGGRFFGVSFTGPGFINGLLASGTPSNIRVSGVSVSGCLGDGINLGAGQSMFVESCTVSTVGGTGIVGDSVSHSTAYNCGVDGIDATNASDCSGNCINNGTGLDVVCTANNCMGLSGGLMGIGLSAATANNCYGLASPGGAGGTGLVAGCAINCYATEGLDFGNADDGYAIIATIANSCMIVFGAVSIVNKYNMP
jgi:hypothetical protein